MKHNVKAPVLYAFLVLFVATLIIYESTNGGSVQVLFTKTQNYFRDPEIWNGLQEDSNVTSSEKEKVSDTEDESKLSSTKVSLPSIGINDDRLAVDDPSSGVQNTGRFNNDTFEVVPLSDVAPAVTIAKMPEEFHHTDEGFDLKDSPLKKILIWNERYGTKTMGFGFGREPFQLAKCEVDSCFVTGNRTFLPIHKFDAVIFHFRATRARDMPIYRSYKQRWIFEEVESASYVYQDPAIYNNLFNWTMTYRRDSDIVYTYGRIFARENQNFTRKMNYAEGKTKMAAWFVSNCHSHSRREKLVKALEKHLTVDIFGKCGKYTCPRKIGLHCYQMLEDKYKFYLSFENSLCKDYVTEKLFNILKYNVVPVVFGLADYPRIAPPGSYINALKYPDVDSLVKYLKYLDGNDTAYNEYFRWKGHYAIDSGWSNTAQPFCDLCKKLHEDQTPKVYHNIRQWFMDQGKCKTIKTKDWLRSLW